jgi:predicted amidohydrolase YtcJ
MYSFVASVSLANVLPLGFDFPVEGINPLLGFYAAVSRLRPDGTSPHGPDGWSVTTLILVANRSDMRTGSLGRS